MIYKSFYKIAFVFLFLTITLNAKDINLQEQITNLKIQIEILKNNQQKINNIEQDIKNIDIKLNVSQIDKKFLKKEFNKKINTIEQDIKKIEEKFNLNKIDKKSFEKDFENYYNITNRQDIRIEDINSNINFWGIIFSIIGVLTGIFVFIINKKYAKEAKEEAKKEASQEVKRWIDEKADEEFKPKVDEYLNKIEEKSKDLLEKIEKDAEKLNTEHRNEIDLLKNEKYTDIEKSKIHKDAKDVINIKTSEDDYSYKDWYKLFIDKYVNKDYPKALEYINKALSNTDDKYEIVSGLLAKAITLGLFGTVIKSEEAIKVYDSVIEKFDKSENEAILETVAQALFNKGVRLGTLEKSEEEIKVYDSVIEKFDKSENKDILKQVSSAWINKIEWQILLNKELDTDTKSAIEKFSINTQFIMKFEMLNIINNAKVSNQDKQINNWKEKYKDTKLENFGFDELKVWNEEIKNMEVKHRINHYIDIFESKLGASKNLCQSDII